jgi:hypothetical protein
MKGHSGSFPALLLALLLCRLAPFAIAQTTQTEERIDTGRFGTEEAESSGSPEGKGLDTEWLYLGLRVGPSLRFYTPSGDTPYTGGDTHAVSLDTALQANVQALPFLSIQGEMIFTWDDASTWAYLQNPDGETSRYTQDYHSFSLQLPLLAKLDFYPGKFRVSPFLGFYYFSPLGEIENTNSRTGEKQSWSYSVSPPLGLLGGLNGAVKLGPGIIFADLRYAADLGESEGPGGEGLYRRSMLSLSLGYEFGFLTKKKGESHE